MVTSRTTATVKQLLRYIEQPLEANIDLRVLSPTNANASGANQQTLTEILFEIMNISLGGLTTQQIIEKLRDYGSDSAASSDINKFVTVYVDSNSLQPNNTISSIVNGNTKGLSIIQLDTIRITPAGRDVGAVCALLNSIPTIELNRCVPYLTIDVQVGRPPLATNNLVQGFSLNKFLGGAFDAGASGDKQLMLALQGHPQLLDESNQFVVNPSATQLDVTVSGMELFTSPQSLTNPDPALDVGRAGPVIDRFRPLMSIDKLSIEVTPQVGFFAYRSADLDITLHDRSRLPEIADFIRADLYGSTELLIEYGWSHPDTSEQNVYGSLLNSMRSREKYGIVNSSFSMTAAGEVKIKLKLFTRGMSDMQIVRIGDDGDAMESVRAVRNLQKVVASIKARLSQGNPSGNKEIRGEQQLFAGSDDIGSALVLSAASQDLVKKFLQHASKSTNTDINDLSNALTQLYGKDGKGGQTVKDLNKSVASTISEKLRSCKKATQQTDPFLFSVKNKLKTAANITIDTDKKNYVSFAKLMAMFVGKPLLNNEKYEDVQLIFYPFNAKAGACANHNISEFILNVDELEKSLFAVARSQGLQLSLRDFIQHIANNFIDDISNPAYGLSAYYTTEIDSKTGVRNPPSSGNKNLDATKLYDHVQARLLSIGSQDGTFKPPQIDVIVETVPAAATKPGESGRFEKLKTVMKIHFFDRCSTAYEGVGALLMASRDEDLRTIGNVANNVASEHAALFNETIKRAQNVGGVQTAAAQTQAILSKINATITEPGNVYNVKFDMEKLRSFIRQNVPTIVYGTMNTGVKDATFATIQNALLSTVHMLRAGETGPLSPSGLTKANIPLRTLPAKVSMTTLGCPLFQYMQQFFIDFGTNTTIDNIYGINKLSHDISPSKFESRIDFVPLDAYGRYESLPTQVGVMLQQLDDIKNK